jgi:predicted lipoprotein with Yx(FWY)xxD motif
MRYRKVSPIAWGLMLAMSYWVPAWSAVAPPDVTKGYPAEVALNDEGEKGLLFRRFPGGQRLYIYDLDRDNQSNCNLGCDGPRPPVYISCTAKPMQDWTIVRRYNGLCQWAYRGHPLYTYFHDTPEDPKGDGEGGVWHLLDFMKKP